MTIVQRSKCFHREARPPRLIKNPEIAASQHRKIDQRLDSQEKDLLDRISSSIFLRVSPMTGVSARTCNNPEMFIHFESKPAIVPSSEVEIFVGRWRSTCAG